MRSWTFGWVAVTVAGCGLLGEDEADPGGGRADAADASADAADSAARPEADTGVAGDAAPPTAQDAGGGGGDDKPWTSSTCPPFRVITPSLCDDPVTGCICDRTPPTCAPGQLCLGGACFTPGQRRPEECAPDGRPAGVDLDTGALEGVTTVTGPVNLEADDGGWALLLPSATPGQRGPVLRVDGMADPPIVDGEVVEVITCVLAPSPGLQPRTVQLRKDGEIRLLAAVDATYVRQDECLPEAWFPEMLDVNCPTIWDGDDADRTCRVCRPAALSFPGARKPVVTRQTASVTLDGIRFDLVGGDHVAECVSTCCGADGKRETLPAAVEFALVAAD